MPRPVRKEHSEQNLLVYLFVVVWFWTLTVEARAPLSISILALCFLAFLTLQKQIFPLELKQNIGPHLKRFFKTLSYSLPALFFVSYAIATLFNLGDNFWVVRFKLSAQTLAIPLFFFFHQKIFRKHQDSFYLILGFFTTVSCLCVLIYMFLNATTLWVAIGQGQPVPTALGHVRFAIISAIIAVSMWWFCLSNFQSRNLTFAHEQIVLSARTGRILACIFAIIITITLHAIAIRSGLLLFYAGLAVLLLRLVFNHWSLKKSMIALSIVAVTVLTLATQSSFIAQKLAYTKLDLQQYDKSNSEYNYSDSGRLSSIKAAWTIIKANPIFGSRGDMSQRMTAAYIENGKPGYEHPPHNQFLFGWVACGIIGLIGVCAFAIAPLFAQNFWKTPLLLEGFVMVLLPFMYEIPLESDAGISICLLALMLPQAINVTSEKN